MATNTKPKSLFTPILALSLALRSLPISGLSIPTSLPVFPYASTLVAPILCDRNFIDAPRWVHSWSHAISFGFVSFAWFAFALSCTFHRSIAFPPLVWLWTISGKVLAFAVEAKNHHLFRSTARRKGATTQTCALLNQFLLSPTKMPLGGVRGQDPTPSVEQKRIRMGPPGSGARDPHTQPKRRPRCLSLKLNAR